MSFIYVGRIDKHKGVNLLVNAFKSIPNRNLKLTLIGDGNELDTLKKETKNDVRIEFLGWKHNNEVKKIIEQSQALILPSLCYENFPTVILEAASLGTPVIASRIGGIPEIIHKIKGVLFNPGDKKDLIKKINWSFNNSIQLKKIGLESQYKINKQKNRYITKINKIIYQS
jgi:glycosyltransferase involved in cell wall biosynthesis